VQALFDGPTVADLAVLLVQKEAEQLDEEMLLQMLAALEALPGDEI
jgi:hypothetical protein